MADVDDFCTHASLGDHISLFRKAALVAQSPQGYEDIDELDKDEKDALRMEVTNKWKHPRLLYLTIILNCESDETLIMTSYTNTSTLR